MAEVTHAAVAINAPDTLGSGCGGAISERDRAIVTLPATKTLRQKIAMFGAAYAVQVKLMDGRVPSYVYDAAVALMTALERWETDENRS